MKKVLGLFIILSLAVVPNAWGARIPNLVGLWSGEVTFLNESSEDPSTFKLPFASTEQPRAVMVATAVGVLGSASFRRSSITWR